ncbi:hypothetical protein EUGRSUZ_F02993 [Eucalyptus grandis]|uniref:Uncharacterized protein n=2 Tax=Eucalyptus grandis TaxID=71139 RepID=A0ACC3KJF3_EUCGR|nr:hypothetical protein EUGRSUZ_F02993 [Eucalyptus grandis]
MAEDPQNQPPAPEAPALAEEVVVGVVPDAPQATETLAAGKELPPPPEAAGEDGPKGAEAEAGAEEKIVKASRFASFKEETNVVGELPEAQRKALDELKRLVREALSKREFSAQPSQPPPKEGEKKGEDKEEAKASAEEPPKPEAEVVAEVQPPAPAEEAEAVFMHGIDREGHPVCYNVYGEFQDKELYQKAFGDEEKRKKFLKWRIQFLERSLRKLDMRPSGVSTVVQVIDLKNSPGLLRRELRQTTGQALHILQDNYPEFVAKQVFINVPWWYLAYNRMISPFLTQRTKSKFVFASPSRTAETLFKYIAPEQVPAQYGGLSMEAEQEFTAAEPATGVTIKPASKHTVEFPVTETCLLVWEAKVVGCDVSYGAEFVPSTEGSYTVIVQKTRKITPADEPIICGRFKAGEPGKVVLTVDNQSSRRKTLLYRSKTKDCSEDQCPC